MTDIVGEKRVTHALFREAQHASWQRMRKRLKDGKINLDKVRHEFSNDDIRKRFYEVDLDSQGRS